MSSMEYVRGRGVMSSGAKLVKLTGLAYLVQNVVLRARNFAPWARPEHQGRAATEQVIRQVRMRSDGR